MKGISFSILLLILILSTACGSAQSAGQTDAPSPVLITTAGQLSTPVEAAATPTLGVPATSEPAPSLAPSVMETPTLANATEDPTQVATPIQQTTPTPDPAAWKDWPVVPVVSDRVVEIYRRGLELGNNPQAYSKVGDCGSTPAWFLGDFDRGPKYFSLGEYGELEAVIQAFQGSHARTSLAAKSGYNASAVFTTLWADRSQCEANETPLACEYRVHRPSFVFVMLGTNDVYHPDRFEPQMRKLIEFSIENGIIPILTTKADNVEGDGSINATITRLAAEYRIPLWNYWRAVQSLPDQGLQPDQVHITWGPNRFDDPRAITKGWPIRNLTALQALDAVWRKINKDTGE